MYPSNTSRSHALFDRAQHFLPGGNSRLTLHFAPYPIYAASAHGCHVTDVDGATYVDYVNNFSSLIHGHGRPEVVDALCRQAHKVMAVGLPTESEIDLAELLVTRLPSVDRVRFCNSGSEAVMFAIRAARAYTGRPKIAKIEGAYHGAYDYAEASLGSAPENWGDDAAPAAVGYARGTPQGLLEDVVVLPLGDVDTARALLEQHADALAGVLIDPLISRMNFLPVPEAFLDMVQTFCAAHPALLILDEVFSFRLDYHGAQKVFGLDPDLTALGKIIGGGSAIGAVGGKQAVMEVFDPRAGYPPVPHGGTYNANPLAMVAGKASMDLMTPAAFTHINALGARLRKGIDQALSDAGIAGCTQGMGSMCAIVPDAQPYRDYRGFQPVAQRCGPFLARLHRHLLNHGVLIAPQGVLIVSTPMTTQVIDETIDTIRICLKLAGQD